ncbi:MAG: hypothetical protein NVV70_16885 [Cellulomonas sp.]|nr:hypothetical protein [Cellulomonas sp.]MCR6649722.1 hypothetical protein [Cellulomonas sp.]
MSLTSVARRLTVAELAREPRSLSVLAYFDGWARGCNPAATPQDYPRRLTTDEARCWREGYDDGRASTACHRIHGFGPHVPECGGWKP